MIANAFFFQHSLIKSDIKIKKYLRGENTVYFNNKTPRFFFINMLC